MKKLIIPAMALAMASQPVEGQTLYEAVYENVQKVLNLPAASAAEKQENQFKLEALNYLKTKGQQEGLTRDSYFLDSQAVNLTSFIDDFLTNVRTAEKSSIPSGRVRPFRLPRNIPFLCWPRSLSIRPWPGNAIPA